MNGPLALILWPRVLVDAIDSSFAGPNQFTTTAPPKGGAICARDSSCRRPRSCDEMHVRCASRGTSEEQVSPWPHVSLRLLLPRASYERRHPSRRPRVLCRCLSAVSFPFLSFSAVLLCRRAFAGFFLALPWSCRGPSTAWRKPARQPDRISPLAACPALRVRWSQPEERCESGATCSETRESSRGPPTYWTRPSGRRSDPAAFFRETGKHRRGHSSCALRAPSERPGLLVQSPARPLIRPSGIRLWRERSPFRDPLIFPKRRGAWERRAADGIPR